MATMIMQNVIEASEKAAPNGLPTIEEFKPSQFDAGDMPGSDPVSVVQLVIELQIEKMRTAEAIRARDAVVHKLAEAYDSLRQKTSALDRLQAAGYDRSTLTSPVIGFSTNDLEVTRLKEEVASLQQIIRALQDEIKLLRESASKSMEPPPRYEDGLAKLDVLDPFRTRPQSQPVSPEVRRPGPRPIDSPLFSQSSPFLSSCSCQNSPNPNMNETMAEPPELEGPFYTPQSEDMAEMVKARCSILASLPLPNEVPDDMLSPLTIPAPYSFNDFIASMSGPLRASIGNYRVFHALNTVWCPEREEHGYFYTPVFKCSTNPRVNTAHRWTPVDVINRMNKPTECFFNKDGTWYYAGVYKSFRLADLTTKEWSELSNEATHSIVKETIAARKNTSPQNVYEITQLYAAGALKAACIALQCVSFNSTMYKALLEHTSVFAQNKAKTPFANGGPGTPGAVQVNGGASGVGTGHGTAGVVHVSTPISPVPVPIPVPMAGCGLRSSAENWSGSSGSSSQVSGGAAGGGLRLGGGGEHQLVATFNGMSLGKQMGEKGEVKK